MEKAESLRTGAKRGGSGHLSFGIEGAIASVSAGKFQKCIR